MTNTTPPNDLSYFCTRLKMLVLQDDSKREYAYGPVQGPPDTKVGTFTPALYEEAKKKY